MKCFETRLNKKLPNENTPIKNTCPITPVKGLSKIKEFIFEPLEEPQSLKEK